jgi:CDP-paratose 2-epimerase
MSPASRDRHAIERSAPTRTEGGRVLVTGGAGFIGCNLAHRLLESGRTVRVLDDFSREGVERNAEWLQSLHGRAVTIERGDVRDPDAVGRAVRDAAAVFHFAAQVAVTSSLDDPAHDFAINAGGTVTVLEAVRRRSDPPPLVFTSTNKVYGSLEHVEVEPRGNRYVPCDPVLRDHGVDERTPLDFRTPYGCSKGTADQYVRDFGRSFGMPTVVFRMSCIYGPRQFGTEDQGWVAHLLRRAVDERPITIYGDGLQARDLLFVDDLVDALVLAERHAPRLAGHVFNIGGGPRNAASVLEVIERITQREGRAPELRYEPWRRGDQRYYVSDTAAFGRATGWVPRVGISEGFERLHRWIRELSGAPAAYEAQ